MTFQVYKAPQYVPVKKGKKDIDVFLAGSIEMGAAEDWQEVVTTALQNHPVNNTCKLTVFNPRRDSWDTSWTQSIHNPQFKEQVTWELDALDRSNIIFMYFSPETKSPISLLEFGHYVAKKKMVVVCPDGFWRKGNVEVVCDRYNTHLFNSLSDGVVGLINQINWKACEIVEGFYDEETK